MRETQTEFWLIVLKNKILLGYRRRAGFADKNSVSSSQWPPVILLNEGLVGPRLGYVSFPCPLGKVGPSSSTSLPLYLPCVLACFRSSSTFICRPKKKRREEERREVQDKLGGEVAMGNILKCLAGGDNNGDDDYSRARPRYGLQGGFTGADDRPTIVLQAGSSSYRPHHDDDVASLIQDLRYFDSTSMVK